MSKKLHIEPKGGASWLSLNLPKMLGVDYALCTPIIAGQVRPRKDIAGRDIDFNLPPRDAVFYNLRADEAEADKYGDWQLDYISGNSDPMEGVEKLKNETLIYWSLLESRAELHVNDAVIVEMASISDVETAINNEWLCLRRVSGNAENGKVKVKTLLDGSVDESYIDRKAIVGRVFGRFDAKGQARVHIAKRLPFAKDIRTPHTAPNL